VRFLIISIITIKTTEEESPEKIEILGKVKKNDFVVKVRLSVRRSSRNNATKHMFQVGDIKVKQKTKEIVVTTSAHASIQIVQFQNESLARKSRNQSRGKNIE
jgi:hypothetical protein